MQLTAIDKNRIRIQARAELELRKRFGNFQSFTSNVNPRFVWYHHCLVLAHALERVATGQLKRLMVFEPVRHGKSQEVSRTFPPYYLRKNPRHSIGLVSYSDNLAVSLSRDARDNYTTSGRKVRYDVSSPSEWHTLEGGIMWACGIGGSITGKGGDLLIIDDPVKNMDEAKSERIQERNIEWYDSVFDTRLEPNGAIIICQTRWHENDLAGKLLAREESNPENWHIINFPALCEEKPMEFPSTCTVESDWRQPGEALCPERYPKERLDKIKSRNNRVFMSLYQQRPTAAEGNKWKREWFKGRIFKLGKEPKLSNIGTDWDTAYTDEETNAATAYIKSGIDAHGNIYILDLDWRWLEFPEQVKWIAKKKAPHYIEAKATGKSVKQVLRKKNIAAYEVKVLGGDKISRTNNVLWIGEEKKIWVEERLLDRFLDDPQQGILRFPNSKYKDLNDVLVQALNRLVKLKSSRILFEA